MMSFSISAMRNYLCKSLSPESMARLSGRYALGKRLRELGFHNRVGPSGWLIRTAGSSGFGYRTAALFPEILDPTQDYPADRRFPDPTHSLHTICATFHQSGIAGYYCAATVGQNDDPATLGWNAVQLGLPVQQPYQPLVTALAPLNFAVRERNYNFLRYHTDAEPIPANAVPEEFSKEHLRVLFNTHYMVEISDIDGIFWGQQHTYPIEIKEKTPGTSTDMGLFFGLDVGPFVKLAFYAAKRGNLHSLYVVREIDNTQDRNLVQWWVITFDHLAQFASWIPQAGGPSMGGGRSSVVRVPRSEFQQLNAAMLNAL